MKTLQTETAALIGDAVYLRTPLGIARIAGNDHAITTIRIVDAFPEPQETAKDYLKTGSDALEREVASLNKGKDLLNNGTDLLNTELLLKASRELLSYFAGSLKQFTFPMAPEGTPFQQSVWKRLQEIPFGKSMSYLELSKDLGDPKAIRAVAAANGKNPIWIAIPCHRIIGSDGTLVGYAGGLYRKKWLLNHESPNRQVALFD